MFRKTKDRATPKHGGAPLAKMEGIGQITAGNGEARCTSHDSLRANGNMSGDSSKPVIEDEKETWFKDEEYSV